VIWSAQVGSFLVAHKRSLRAGQKNLNCHVTEYQLSLSST